MKIFRHAESSANIQIFVEITVENSQYDINKNLFELFTVNMKTNSLSWRQGIRHTIVTNNRCTAFHKEDYHLCLDSGIRRNHIFSARFFRLRPMFPLRRGKRQIRRGLRTATSKCAHPICSLVEAPWKREKPEQRASCTGLRRGHRNTSKPKRTSHQKISLWSSTTIRPVKTGAITTDTTHLLQSEAGAVTRTP